MLYPIGQDELGFCICVEIFNGFNAVDGESKIEHDDQESIVIYCVESRAEVHMPQVDVVSKYLGITEDILHHQKLSGSSFISTEALLAAAEYVVIFSKVSHAFCQEACVQCSHGVR